MNLHHQILSQLTSSVHNNVSLSDADISLVSSVKTCSTAVSLLFHSAVSNNFTSLLVPPYSGPAHFQIPTSKRMRLLSSNVDKLSELFFHMISEEVEIAAITEVSPKTPCFIS